MSQDFIDHQLLPMLVQKTAQLLEEATNQLLLIVWTDSESNTDSGYSMLACQKFEEAFLLFDAQNVKIAEIKTPDIQIVFNYDGQLIRRKIELKSCKNSVIIPGSTISSLDLNIWVIFCKRSLKNTKFEFRYGRYYLGLTTGETELFQDRTPRPRISWAKYQASSDTPIFETITNDKDWIKKYAKAAINRILCKNITYSWQDDLVREIIKIAILENILLEDLTIEKDDKSI